VNVSENLLAKAKTLVETVVKDTKEAVKSVTADVVKKIQDLKTFNLSKTFDTTITLANIEKKILDDLVSIKASLTVKPSITFSLNIKDLKLDLFKIEIAGVVTGKIEGSYSASKTFDKSVDLVPSTTFVTVQIPTPLPGLFISVSADGHLTADFEAKGTVSGSLGSAEASGTVGASAVYTKSWNATKHSDFEWKLTKPTVDKFEAEASVTLTPAFGLKIGVSGLAILGAQAGPVLSFPLAFTLGFNALDKKCKLHFEIGFAIVLGISAEVTFIGQKLVGGEVASPKLYEKTLYEKCFDGFFGSKTFKKKYY